MLRKRRYPIERLSYTFPFTIGQLRTYKSILNWENISINENIDWSIDLLREFADRFDLNNYGRDKDVCGGMVEGNKSIPWSVELIDAFREHWDWEMLAQNPVVMGDKKIRAYFHFELGRYFEIFYRTEEEDIPQEIWENYHFNPFETDEEYLSYPENIICDPADIEKLENPDWLKLSDNDILPWNAELIKKYESKWSWVTLCLNEGIPWDYALMKTFEHRIEWGNWRFNKDGSSTLEPGIALNSGIKWDFRMISTFGHRMENVMISNSSTIDWNIDLICALEYFWDYEQLAVNDTVWEKVFKEFSSPKECIKLLNMLLATDFN